VKAEKEG